MRLPIFIKAFRKLNMVLDCRIFKSNLFHFDIVDGKNEYLKISVLRHNVAISSTLISEYCICDCFLE